MHNLGAMIRAEESLLGFSVADHIKELQREVCSTTSFGHKPGHHSTRDVACRTASGIQVAQQMSKSTSAKGVPQSCIMLETNLYSYSS